MCTSVVAIPTSCFSISMLVNETFVHSVDILLKSRIITLIDLALFFTDETLADHSISGVMK